MKRIISNVMLVAAAAMAFFACQKPEAIEPATSEDVMLTFSSEKPAFDDETKTEWTGETIQWSKGDKISVAYTVEGNWQNASGNASGDAKLYKSEELKEASTTAQFNVSTYFNGETEGTHVFYGVYPAPAETDFPNAPDATLSVAPSQTPKANSFDPNGDLMVGFSNEFSSRPADGETISLKWERIVAHAVISLKNINGLTADEKIENITLTAQDDANLVGQQKVNLITKEVVKDNATANILKLSASNLTVKEDILSFWACVLPETITSLTVVVETDKATYTRKITGISKTFKQNARNTLAVKMDEAVRVEKVVASDEVVDVLTKSITGATSTTYVDWSGKTLTSSAVYAGNSAGGNESIQLRSNNSNSGIVTTTSGGFAKKVALTWESNTANGRTLNVYGSNSAYSAPTDLYDDAKAGTKLGTIVCGTSTELVIDGDYEYVGLRSNSGAMYISEIQITWSTAAVVPDTTPAIVVSGETSKSVEFDGGEVTFNYTLKNLDGEELTWEVSDEEMISSVSAEDGVLTVTVAENDGEARTATITLSCGDADDVVLILNQAEYVDASVIEEITVADFLSKSVDANVWYQLTGTIKEIKNTTYGNFYLEDETGYVYVYGLTKTQVSSNDKSFESIGLREGDTVTLIGTRAQYASASVADQKEQVGGPAYYVSHVVAPYVELTMESASVDAETTSYTVDIKSNSNWIASASTDVTLDKTSGNGDASIKMTFTENTTSDAVTHTLTVAVEGSTKTFTLTQKGVVSGGDNEPVVVFAESFSKSTGTMGWSDNAGNGTFATDNTGWTVENAYGAGGSAKFGTSKKLGKATTPALNITGNATLKFKAGAWTGDQTNLKLSMSGGTLSVTSVTMKDATWTEYEVTITNATSGAKVTFEGKQASKARFFLDDIEIIQN